MKKVFGGFRPRFGDRATTPCFIGFSGNSPPSRRLGRLVCTGNHFASRALGPPLAGRERVARGAGLSRTESVACAFLRGDSPCAELLRAVGARTGRARQNGFALGRWRSNWSTIYGRDRVCRGPSGERGAGGETVTRRLRSPRWGNAQDARCPSCGRQDGGSPCSGHEPYSRRSVVALRRLARSPGMTVSPIFETPNVSRPASFSEAPIE